MSTQETRGQAPGRIRQKNEALILKAAEHVFAAGGFRGATTSAIAEKACLPKANIHYYFGTKAKLYRAVLDDILKEWLSSFENITEEDDPATALSNYVRAKIEMSRRRPEASRVFANELIRGAPRLQKHLRTDLYDWVEEKSHIIEGWIAQGKMAPVDPKHLFIHIWSITQTYADFEPQCAAVLGHRDHLGGEDFERAAEAAVTTVLRACGLEKAERKPQG